MRRELIRTIVLVLGGIVIIASIICTAMRLTDKVVFTVLLPGVNAGLLLIVIYLVMGKRSDQS